MGHRRLRIPAGAHRHPRPPPLSTDDDILPPPYAHWIHERIPHADLHWIDGAGHLLQEDAPAQLISYLAEMLNPPS